jgi:hypothetical protein
MRDIPLQPRSPAGEGTMSRESICGRWAVDSTQTQQVRERAFGSRPED